MPRVDKISSVPRSYCRNRLARPNSRACTRIAGQPEISVLVPLRARIERCLKTLVAKRDPREPVCVPKLACSRAREKKQIKIKFKILKIELGGYSKQPGEALLGEWLAIALCVIRYDLIFPCY